jgi:hypothetical protein
MNGLLYGFFLQLSILLLLQMEPDGQPRHFNDLPCDILPRVIHAHYSC